MCDRLESEFSSRRIFPTPTYPLVRVPGFSSHYSGPHRDHVSKVAKLLGVARPLQMEMIFQWTSTSRTARSKHSELLPMPASHLRVQSPMGRYLNWVSLEYLADKYEIPMSCDPRPSFFPGSAPTSYVEGLCTCGPSQFDFTNDQRC